MKILIIGDKCTDRFIYGTIDRICPEAPVPVFNPSHQKENQGMAGNVYANIKSLISNKNGEVELITNTTDILKERYVDKKSNQMLLRVDSNDICDQISDTVLETIEWSNYDAVIVSDYCKGFLTEENIKHIVNSHPLTFVDTKKEIGEWIESATFIKINQPEYTRNQKRFEEINLKGDLIVTLGEAGVQYNNKVYPPTEVIEALDLSGAGDTFLSGLVVDYLETGDIEHAIKYANECALVVVQQKGVTVI
tara:strand:+ start:383 stop:1132 length:750 start_codon:yes stop_codon:yes gene_type:complete